MKKYNSDHNAPPLLHAGRDSPNKNISDPTSLYITGSVNNKRSKLLKIISFSFLALTSVALCYLSYNAYRFSNIPNNIESIPLIRANINPIKTVPSDPGGAKILNQDKLIYAQLQDPAFKSNKKTDLKNPSHKREDVAPNNANQLRNPKELKKTKVEPAPHQEPLAASPKPPEPKPAPKPTKPSLPQSSNPFDVMDKKS